MVDVWPDTESDGFECPAEPEDAITGKKALDFSERFINYIKPDAELYICRRIPEVFPAQQTLSLAGSKTFAGVLARAKHLPWPEQQSARRAKAVLRWRFIIEECIGASTVSYTHLTLPTNREV